MKPLVLFAFFALSTISWAQTFINWSPPIEVAGSSDAHRPKMALTADNKPLIVWSKFLTDEKNSYFSKWDNNGFLPPFQLNDTTLLTYDFAGTEIDTDGNQVYVVFKEIQTQLGRVFIRRSDDGGLTWGNKIMVESASGEGGKYPHVEGYDGNNVLVTYMTHASTGGNPQYVVRRSSDSGATFAAPPASISSDFGAEACYCCPPGIVANSSYQVMTFRNDVNNIRDMKAGVSTNGGTSFDTQISLDDHLWYLNSCPGTGGDLGLNGSQLYATYMSDGEGDEMIYFAEDDLSDASPYSVVHATLLDSATHIKNPHMANLGDTVILVWEQSYAGETDVWYNASYDGMNSWAPSNARRMFQLEGIQNRPDIEIGSDGSIHAVYLDAETNKVMYRSGSFSAASLEESTLGKFEMYPNPSSGLVNLSGISPNTIYSIFDIRGQKILESNGNIIDTQSFSSGVYYVQVEGYRLEKLIVQ